MIDASKITEAVEELLKASYSLNNYNVERSSIENSDPGRCPWVGIYRGRVTYQPKRMGAGAKNWSADVSLKLIIQAATHMESAEEQLEDQINNVITAIEKDRTLKGTVNMVLGYDIEYFISREATEDSFYQQAVVTISTEVKA